MKPLVLTRDQVRAVCAMRADGACWYDVCAELGISPGTGASAVKRAAWALMRVKIPERGGRLPEPFAREDGRVSEGAESFVCADCGRRVAIPYNAATLERYRHEGRAVCSQCHERYVKRSRARSQAARRSDVSDAVRHLGPQFWGAQ